MKYIITESKLEKAIYDYIDGQFGDVNMSKALGNDGELEGAYDFFLDDYDGDYLFTWTSADYYNSNKHILKDKERHQKLLDKSPIVELMDYPEQELNVMFGNRWKPVFKQWFEDKFDLPVTTIH